MEKYAKNRKEEAILFDFKESYKIDTRFNASVDCLFTVVTSFTVLKFHKKCKRYLL